MTIEEVLKDICDEQIPKEINGVNTKYLISKFKSVIGNKVVEIRILPTNITKNNIGVVQRYTHEAFISYDFGDCVNCMDMLYLHLKRDIHEMLCQYIQNIIKWTNGKVVKEIQLDGEAEEEP